MDQAGWDARYSGPELVWGNGPNRFVAAELDGLPAGRGLDLGTGEGRNAIWLAGNGWRMTAVDFSAAGLARARALAEARGVAVDWVHADLIGYQPDGLFDLVLIAYVQLPAGHLAALVRTAAGAVAPGGTLLVVGHDRDNLAHGHGGPTSIDVLYTPSAVTAELDGLAVDRAEQVTRLIPTPDGDKTAIDTLVRAVRPAGPPLP